MSSLPQRTRVYQNHHMDSTRWDYFEPRHDDIVIATSYKAGTTWTQAIIAHLLFPDGRFPAAPFDMSPWLDMRIIPLEVVLNKLKAQQHRRFIKTHLPLDGLPYRENTKYLYIARDARDVFMSLWNHYSTMKDETLMLMNHLPGRQGDALLPPPDDIHVFWKNWITRGSFAWENDGWPYWSHLSNVQSWWPYRHLTNIALFHYGDMLVDPEREIRRMAAFLEIDVPDHAWDAIVKAVSFAEMKQQGDLYAPAGGQLWKGGAAAFLHKGTNGRWRDVLSENELAFYEAACKRVLTDESKTWLEKGGSF
ncbi:aryl sulfotransferase [Nitrosomonas sp. Nm51]|uniref:sulfotransferase domain-containing protein n=1 Tax=Nitrosomonas sp. Nm51 TaxID=133720 RepID=UPI0008B801EE|nr:sulfotransferase domain-containing protein [Nitrosomonas sp. Nm51]SEQ98930.1 aryl sulfotransferase [Nitrosomonas sp. Nm51]